MSERPNVESSTPMLVDVGRRLTFVPPGVASEDLDHQLISEALHVARAFAMPRSTRYVQRWLETRLLRRMTRWLAALEHQRTESLEQVAEGELASNGEVEMSLDGLADSGVPHEDLVLLYRSRVHGITARELADDIRRENARSRRCSIVARAECPGQPCSSVRRDEP